MSTINDTISNTKRALAWVETHELPDDLGVHINTSQARSEVILFASTTEAMREARRLVGPMRKVESVSGFRLAANVDGLCVEIYPPVDACKRVKVGTRVEQVAREVRPAETVTVEEEVDVFEWDCGGVLVDDEVPA